MRFERVVDQELEVISFQFGKYDMPRFHVRLMRLRPPPDEFVRTAQIVKSQKQYCHEWGKPYGLPMLLWPNYLADKVVRSVVEKLPQALQFLSSGERGPNISLQPNVKPFVERDAG
jgi:hypothetical protein